jgi:hypothetical protein
MYVRYLFLLIFLTAATQHLCAQASADSGFGNVGSLGTLPTLPDSTPQTSSMRITQSVGLGEDGVWVVHSLLDAHLQLSQKIRFQIRGPLQMSRSSDARTVSIGDIFLIYSYNLLQKKQHVLVVNAGVKLPTNQSNMTWQDSILPMVYQTSMGSVDAILSVQHQWHQSWGVLSISAGYQQPFFHINRNKTPETLELRRMSDILLKAEPLFKVGKKWHIGAGMLWIYHTGNDTRLSDAGKRVEIAGSKGSTFNLQGALHWQAAKNIQLGMTFGAPVVSRDMQPDGLHRKFVVNPYFQLRF